MTTKYFLAPNARWQGRNLTGQPAIGGKLYTYVHGTSTPKATYQDKNASVPNTNPVILDGKGEANIYWATDDLYKIELYTSSDQLVYSQDNYPYVDSDGSGTPTVTIVTNLIRNPQFSWWNNSTSFSPVNNSANANDYVCDDWIFQRSNTSSTIEISRGTFTPDNTEVPGTPVYYLHYNASASGAGETYRRLSQSFQGVRSLAGETVAISFWAKRSTTPVNIAVNLRQYFGSGGSADASTAALGQTPLTESWAQYTNSVTLPSVSGKTIGAGDALIFDFAFDPNTSGIIDICNVEMQVASTITPSPYQTLDEQFKHLDATVNESVVPTGSLMHTIVTTAPAGWVLCNDGTIGNPVSGANTALVRCKALFTLIWDNILNPTASGPIYTPIYDSAGVLSTKGASAEADWNANKRLSLTKALGRVLSGANPTPTPLLSMTFNSTNVTNTAGGLQIALADTSSFITGTKVRFTTSTGSLPAGSSGLTAGVDYYVINLSATTIHVATSLANAIANSPITYTNSGTAGAVFTIIQQATAHPFGSYLGEDAHALVVAEIPSHNHPGSTVPAGVGAGTTGFAEAAEAGSPHAATIAAQGGSGYHNNIQPTTYLNIMLKL